MKPIATETFDGDMLIDFSVALSTEKTELPLIAPEEAVIVAVPEAFVVTSPEVLTDATFPLLLDQVTPLVRSVCDPSLKTPVAVSCC